MAGIKDDTNVLLRGNNQEDIREKGLATVQCINNWTNSNGLKLNINKTSFVEFIPKLSGSRDTGLLLAIHKYIQQLDNVTFLGVKLNSKLTRREHIEMISSKLSKDLFLIQQLKYTITLPALMTLYHARIESIIRLVTLAFLGSIGMTFVILACALPHYQKWWPFFEVLFYILAPIPTLIARRYNDGSGSSNSCLEAAIFVTMGILVSSFALPIVLARVPVIDWGACYLTLAGNVVVYATLLGFFLTFDQEDSDYNMW